MAFLYVFVFDICGDVDNELGSGQFDNKYFGSNKFWILGENSDGLGDNLALYLDINCTKGISSKRFHC